MPDTDLGKLRELRIVRLNDSEILFAVGHELAIEFGRSPCETCRLFPGSSSRSGEDLSGLLVAAEAPAPTVAMLSRVLAVRGYRVVLAPSSKRDSTPTLKGPVTSRDALNAERVRSLALTALLHSHDLSIHARRALSASQIAAIAAWRQRDERLAKRSPWWGLRPERSSTRPRSRRVRPFTA